MTSQGLNSFSNLGLAVLTARASTPSEYGAWAVSYLIYVTTLGLARATAATPLLLHDAGRPAPTQERHGAVSLTTMIGVGAGCLAFILGIVFPSLRPAAFSLGPFLPALLVQDTLRNIYFQRLAPRGAAVTDMCWLGVQGIFFALLLSSGRDSIVTLTLAWSLASLLAILPGLRLLGGWPTPSAALAFLRRHQAIAGRLAVDQTLSAGRTQATPVVVASTAGLAVAGALRAVLTLMGAVSALVLAMTPVATVDWVRALARGASPTRLLWRWSLWIALISFLNGCFFLALPAAWGHAILGSNWEPARALLIPMILHTMIRGPILGVPIMLKAASQVKLALRLRYQIESVALVFPVGGAIVWGAQGAAWGYFVGGVVMVAQCLWAMRGLRLAMSQDALQNSAASEEGQGRP